MAKSELEKYVAMPQSHQVVIALGGLRLLAPLLYESEYYVDSKLIEVASEVGLDFFVHPSLIFNRLYGMVDPLIFRAQEVQANQQLLLALQAGTNSVLACCKLIHQYHVTSQGIPGPVFDCYMGEVHDGTALESIENLQSFHRENGTNQEFEEWFSLSLDNIHTSGLKKWITEQNPLCVFYPWK